MSPTTYDIPGTANINDYRDAKLKILKRDFYIRLTPDELEHAKTLKTEIQIDNFFISAINRHWN